MIMASGKRNRKIGILGGTFDPVHYGHLAIGQLALEVCQLDELYFVPTGKPPHKLSSEVTSANNRYEMLRIAVSVHPQFSICDYEIKRDSPSYTQNLLLYFREQFPEDELHLVMGADLFHELELWYHYQELFSLAHLVIMNRENSDPVSLEEKAELFRRNFQASITLVSGIRLQVSSSMIRKRVRDKHTIRYLTPDTVVRYIEDKQLYQKQVNNLE